jgi:hypothetical protein
MARLVFGLLLLCAGCGAAPQPQSLRTVAAYEVSLPAASDKSRFLSVLQMEAQAHGYHVDAASTDELKQLSTVSPISFNASVWRGNDEEIMASAMDFKDHLGRVWISFPVGEDQQRSAHFRADLVQKIREDWPDTASLPIMPSGAIPLTDDLIRTSTGYVVKSSEAGKYTAQPH